MIALFPTAPAAFQSTTAEPFRFVVVGKADQVTARTPCRTIEEALKVTQRTAKWLAKVAPGPCLIELRPIDPAYADLTTRFRGVHPVMEPCAEVPA